MSGGRFIVSLDFELHWGICDHTPVSGYRENLLGARRAIPQLLEAFERHGVRATWATVGMLFARDRKELERTMPDVLPTYVDPALSAYRWLGEIGADEQTDPFHYGRSLIERIARTPGQEIATHTFSHYYCLEPGQRAEQFRADLLAARAIGRDFGDVCGSLVLPRNQHNPAYDDVLDELGVRAVRRCPDRFGLRPIAWSQETKLWRAARLLQTYAVLDWAEPPVRHGRGPVLLETSVFLRPWSPRTRWVDRARLGRIVQAMTSAAREGRAFHLWWHPHNFGTHPQENFAMLETILQAFRDLRRKNDFESVTMGEEAALVS